METSLSVQNDAILKKAKWLIVSGLVLALIIQCVISYLVPILTDSFGWTREDTNIFYSIGGLFSNWLLPILCIVAWVLLLVKHTVKSIRVWSTMAIIRYGLVLLFAILNVFVWDKVLDKVFPDQGEMQWVWYTIIQYIGYFITTIIALMGLAALWKNKQIKANYGNVLRLLILVTFIGTVLSLPSEIWTIRMFLEFIKSDYFTANYDLYQSFGILFGNVVPITSLILQILIIYCYCKLLKTPSLMPTEDNPDELPYSYCPTKVEIGFVVCVALFIGCIFLTFLIV